MTDLFHDAPLFHEVEGNPRPENATGGFFTTRDGKKIRYGLFAAVARPMRGTVVLLGGRNECIEKYFETIRDLAARGFGVATLDWRGQGDSDRLIRDRQRGYVRSFRDYTADLEQFFEEIVLPDCRGPYYILAHSAGAVITLLAAPSMVNRVRRMVLIAPFLTLPDLPVSIRTVRRVCSLFCALGLGRLYAAWGPRPRHTLPFEVNKVTSDPQRYRRNTRIYEEYPQLALGGPTIRWLQAAAKASEAISDPDFMARIQVPLLIIAAGADQVVSTKAVEKYARSLRLGSLLMIDGAKHEILQEVDLYREQFLAAFDAFVPGSDDPTA
ncbi:MULTISPECIES: alpha/beta hydrolase [unclassified Mesorhizobium]|uniref:alpha/beta fold hydrolase n=1 Tax=unclassified Mesorhizobium TaxID=325217 RepID=UPI000FCB8D49|nr:MULTISPECIES: alpha/beta hydrolase [unclassified Mesorhizobium]TGR48708.1 alpha/beta hydrolase [bacterium M00.F.Ca.ET.199.01.1.1]TGU37749.1 alpha/beta hydrolase [bacterium M00.F.Ca.ET.156.01.1.1]TGV88834.1 alpha/beta hydrolase [Mesorhizobium sp. M00.F.Ca.ET.149.01.1.1]RUW50583.1 alpha/beta hydrolase [Mesorhizobium sp. M8A.F.Ca.ET.021.01.1.1]RWC91314.1 MAG: alpha/beta hydrolase [Mesorhizobium sp.]